MSGAAVSIRTAARVANMRALLGRLSQGEMPADAIAATLRMSASGARNYVRDLIGYEIVEEDACNKGGRGQTGQSVFRLSADEQAIERFISGLEQGGSLRGKGARQPPLTRRIHILQDDEPRKVRGSRAPIGRDWAVAALFGAVGARA